MKKVQIISYLHALLTVALAAFFIYKGTEKFGPMKLREKNINVENRELIMNKIIVEKDYAAPYGYDITMNTFRQSGFLKMIGVFQILAGVLMILPKSRMAGLLMLLPIITNIFLMHFFFDNRAHENYETGRLLLYTIILVSFYWKRLLSIIWPDKLNVAIA